LLDVTRFEAGREQLQLTSFDVVDLLNELTEVMRPVAQEKNLWLRTQGVSSMVIEGDRVKLYRIAQNLLQNAIKYTRVGGVQLDWQTGVSEHEWHLTVTDTGPGLSAGHQLASGEGIGLLIVRQLCDLLGGRLSVIEPIEGGTQFILSFSRQYPS
jgi:two-component system CheB/CheR fusion protein